MMTDARVFIRNLLCLARGVEKIVFLDATSHLNKRVGRSVGRSNTLSSNRNWRTRSWPSGPCFSFNLSLLQSIPRAVKRPSLFKK